MPLTLPEAWQDLFAKMISAEGARSRRHLAN